MSWEMAFRIIFSAIISAGGIGAIIVGVIKFSANKIAERLSAKYQIKLDKELEHYKSDLNQKEYVSRTKFDTEFSLYRELSTAFAEMVKTVNILIPAGLVNVPANHEDQLKFDAEHYKASVPAVVNAQDTLNANIPFISESIYNGYVEILHLARMQLKEYESRFVVSDLRPQAEKETFSIDTCMRTDKINEKWKTLNNSIRDYISKLDVVEEK